eukprot:12087091-Karenia_brevis.AAC.1
MLHTAEQHQGKKGIPWVSFPSLSAPGPSGERPEHLRDCTACNHASSRKRLTRILDALTVQWAVGRTAESAGWLLNTSLSWLQKGKAQELDPEVAEWLADVPESDLLDSASEPEVPDAESNSE